MEIKGISAIGYVVWRSMEHLDLFEKGFGSLIGALVCCGEQHFVWAESRMLRRLAAPGIYNSAHSVNQSSSLLRRIREVYTINPAGLVHNFSERKLENSVEEMYRSASVSYLAS